MTLPRSQWASRVPELTFASRQMEEGLELLCRAYNSNPSHPGVVNLLAHYCLLQGDYAKVCRCL